MGRTPMPEDHKPDFRTTRRRFLGSSLGGIWLITRALSLRGADLSEGPGWSGVTGKARYRFDGLAKVMGQKVYARDFHSRDMRGWPATEASALVLRSPAASRILEGIDLSILPSELSPIRVITAEDLSRDKIVFPRSTEAAPGTSASLFVARGFAPEFLGQPVAILLFRDFETFRRAKHLLQFNSSVLRFGDRTSASGPLVGAGPPAYLPSTYLTRYAIDDRDEFSQVANGLTNPYAQHRPDSRPADVAAAQYRSRIQSDIESNGWRLFRNVYQTQQLDPMFMEPETGLGWMDPATSTLDLVLGTQSPEKCVSDSIRMFHSADVSPIKTVVLNTCYPGGGFGGRDASTFPLLMALAAAYAEGPVRLANDRFDQFQSGLKQLGGVMDQSLAVDPDGRFQAVVAKYHLQAGGRNNYSQWVAQLAGYCGGGGYVIPRVSIDAEAEPSIGVIAGAMRGFGGPQAAFAVESLVDEIAAELKADPIALREKNALAKGGRTVTGCRIAHSLRIAEICQSARTHPLWVNRNETRQQHAAGKRLYGVGFALANQAFGTGRDGVMAAVEIAPDGSISVTSNAVDMGNGAATSLAVSTSLLGANASRVNLGDVAVFGALQLSGSPVDWSNPRFTPAVSLSSSACITAFHQVHAVEQACRVLLETALWPAALSEWHLLPDRKFDESTVQWKKGALAITGRPPLPLSRLAQILHAKSQPTGAMVHAAYIGEWITSRFLVDGRLYENAIDGLAIKRGEEKPWAPLDRTSVTPPSAQNLYSGRSLYSPSGTLAAVDVNRQTGDVSVLAVHTILEAGRVIQPELVEGQYQGAVAMGVGYALYEYLPPTAGGPGEGGWNLNRYRVARWSDLPVSSVTLKVLPPVSPDEPARGIAEAVLCPIAPAIVNAITDATGKRFRTLPVTPSKIVEALGA
jgi:CO/xanthine dehydrogenase Mo-binding subunit